MKIIKIFFLLWITLSTSLFLIGFDKKGMELKIEIRSLIKGLEFKERTTIRWWQGNWMDTSEDGAIIINTSKNTFYLVNHTNKTWFGGDQEDALNEMEREITILAQKVRKTYGIQKPSFPDKKENPFLLSTRVVHKGSEKVLGKMCKKYEIYFKEDLKNEIWLDPSIRPGNFLNIKKLIPFLERFTTITSMYSREWGDRDIFLLEHAIQLKLLNLFPSGLEIGSREHREGEVIFEKYVLEIKKWEGDDESFQPPPNYRKINYHEYMEESIPTVRDFLDPGDMEKH